MSAEKISLPVSFNSVAVTHAGGPIELQRKTVPSLKDDEVLIRVGYASINKMDSMFAVRNIFNLQEPYVLGFDFSGEVVASGGEDSQSGSPLTGQQVFGATRTGGGFAEYLVARKDSVLPRGIVPAPEASTLGIAYMTAYTSLLITTDIEQYKGKWIYIAGAGGGVGHFAAQIARMCGLKIIGSAGKTASLRLISDLHLDHIIDYSKQNVADEIMKLTGGRGVDVVYESTGSQSSYVQSAAVIASGGEYIRLGTSAQIALGGNEDMTGVVESRGAKMTITGDQEKIAEMAAKRAEGYMRAVTWYGEGKLKPMITSTVPLDASALKQALDAFRKGENNVGKVVVRCG